jgi:hypothetical protein
MTNEHRLDDLRTELNQDALQTAARVAKECGLPDQPATTDTMRAIAIAYALGARQVLERLEQQQDDLLQATNEVEAGLRK